MRQPQLSRQDDGGKTRWGGDGEQVGEKVDME